MNYDHRSIAMHKLAVAVQLTVTTVRPYLLFNAFNVIRSVVAFVRVTKKTRFTSLVYDTFLISD
jgi:hypothetical protein